VSSPAASVRRACADGFGRLRGLRARRPLTGVLGLVPFVLAPALALCSAGLAAGQFPIRQMPSQRAPLAPREVSVSRSEPPAPPQTPHPAIARITVPEKDGVSYGSGTLIDARGQFGLVVTNWHVVRDAAGTIIVEFPEGHRTAAQVVRTDKDWDLAALSIYRPKAEPLPITGEAPRVGELLTIAGYGSGQYRTASGPLSQYVSPSPDFPEEFLDLAAVEARNGDSGGPIINQHGEVCGVLFGSAPGYTIGAYGGRVRQFLATVLPDGQPGSDTAAIAAAAPTAAGPPPAPAAPPLNRLPAESDPTWSAKTAMTAPRIDVPPPPQATALHKSPPYATNLVEKPDVDPLMPAVSAQQPTMLAAPPRETVNEAAVDPKSAVDTGLAGTAPLDDQQSPRIASRIQSSLLPRLGTKSSPAVDVNEAPPDQLLAAVWKKFGGTTLFDQAKAVLAVVGLLAIAAHFWRASSRASDAGDDE
jgi:serine protease Do